MQTVQTSSFSDNRHETTVQVNVAYSSSSKLVASISIQHLLLTCSVVDFVNYFLKFHLKEHNVQEDKLLPHCRSGIELLV